MAQDDLAVHDDDGAPSSPEYESPSIEVLGTIEELTEGPVGVGGDVNTMVISF